MPKKSHTKDSFVKASIAKYGKDRFNYSNLSFYGMNIHTQFVCNICKTEFRQIPTHHLRYNNPCPTCLKNLTSARTKGRTGVLKKKTIELLAQQSLEMWGDVFDFKLFVYQGKSVHGEVVCKRCNTHFQQSPDKHLRADREPCPTCIENRYSYAQLLEDVEQVHGAKYEYPIADIKNKTQQTDIFCNKHGIFKQTISVHLAGAECPLCSGGCVSKIETRWLDSLGLPNDKQHRQVSIKLNGKNYRADGYDPQTNTVYEMHGDWWHGNLKLYEPDDIHPISKKTYLELFITTTKRSQQIRSAGYNLISTWESEFIKQLKKEKS